MWQCSVSTREYRRLHCPESNPWKASRIHRMRCLLKPARIQLSTICRGFAPWTDCMLRAALFIASTSLMLPPGIGSSRWIRRPSADRFPSPGSERMLIPTLNLFQNKQLGLFCGPLGSIFCDTRIARHLVPWPRSLASVIPGVKKNRHHESHQSDRAQKRDPGINAAGSMPWS